MSKAVLISIRPEWVEKIARGENTVEVRKMRLIDADAFIRFLAEQRVKNTGMFTKGVNKALNIAISALKNQQITPTVDAVPVVRFQEREKAVVQLRKKWQDAEMFICTMCGHFDHNIVGNIVYGNKNCGEIVGYPCCKKFTPWIPCSERPPEELEPVNVVWVNHRPEPYYGKIKDVPQKSDGCLLQGKVVLVVMCMRRFSCRVRQERTGLGG